MQSPYDYVNIRGHQQFAPHSEELLIADFEAKVKAAGYTDYNEVKGNLFIIQSNPPGVCNKCTVGLWNTNKDGKSDIFKRFEERLMYNLQYISSYVKSVIAVTMGEIVFQKLSDEDGVFLYLEKKVGYQLCRKALDLSWEWIERKNANELEPWIFCDYLDDADGIDLISYESDAVKAGDKESANIYGIMNCIILYIAYQAFEYAGKKYLPDYLWGIDDKFYAEGILDYTSKIRGCNFEDILDYCNRKTEKSSNIIFKKEEMMDTFLECK